MISFLSIYFQRRNCTEFKLVVGYSDEIISFNLCIKQKYLQKFLAQLCKLFQKAEIHREREISTFFENEIEMIRIWWIYCFIDQYFLFIFIILINSYILEITLNNLFTHFLSYQLISSLMLVEWTSAFYGKSQFDQLLNKNWTYIYRGDWFLSQHTCKSKIKNFGYYLVSMYYWLFPINETTFFKFPYYTDYNRYR